MSRSFQWLVCGLVAIAFNAKPVFAQSACDRSCLRTMLDQYLTAVTKHDPSAAPLDTAIPASHRCRRLGREASVDELKA